MANLSNVVNVSIIPSGRSLSRTNMNIVAIMTSELGALSSANRTIAYTDLTSVADDFGTNSSMYEYAKILFAQTKNPTNSGGYLVAGFWRASDESVAATAGILTGAQVSEATVVGVLQLISDGSFDVDVDGVTQNVTGVDFRTIDSLDDIVTLLDTSITGATVTEDDQKIVITSDTTGATSELSLLSAGATGTFIGETLNLASGTGAISVDGEAAQVLTAESKETAVTEVLKEEPFKGCVFIDNPTDVETEALSTWGKSNDVIFYDVFDSADNLERDITNVVWKIKLAGGENYRMAYSKVGNRKLAVAVMSRLHTVNFNNQNSAITLNLKELSGIVSEDFTQDEINKAKKVGLDLYTTFGDLPKLLVSGANGFADNVYNFIAIKKFVQIDLFNLLGTTGTKLAQIDEDVNKIVDTVEKTLRLFLKAKVIGAGTWNSPDTFGNVEVFNRNIETNGFYVYAQPLSEQAQSDREARKSPAIQVAFKNAGAIHSVDVTIQYNL
ncbi:DUF3383 family protein [Sulfurimonas sp.]|uniref:DUF3383 family protein n=1 Tax=Sulfurimonas sp. TaxID=2022749 RepID=UPI00356471F8